MVYIAKDGSVADRRKVWRWSLLTDIVSSIYNFFALFLRAVIHPPTTFRNGRTPTNYAQRHGGRSYRSTPGSGKPTTGSNIRGCKDLGGGAPMGGG